MARSAPAQLTARDVGRTLAEQDLVIDQLEVRAGPGNQHWYEVAKAGFNVIDKQCDVYLDGLYQVAKESTQSATVLHAVQNSATVVLKAYGVASLTLDVMAEIFGLASVFNDAASKNYLLSIGPAAVTGVVYNLQTAFRNEIDKSQASDAFTVRIDSPADAVHQIQSYIRLCSPVYIEAHIGKYIAASHAAPLGDAAGGRSDALFLESLPTRQSANISLELRQSQ